MNSTFYKIRMFLNVAKGFQSLSEFINNLLNYFYENMDCSGIVINNLGEILFSKYTMIPQNSCWAIMEDENKIRENTIKKINSIKDILFNFNYNDLSLFDEYNCTKSDKCYGVLIPIDIENSRYISILLFKYNFKFVQEDEIIYEIISSYIFLLETAHQKAEHFNILKKNEDIISVISILSYSEVKAIEYIINELNGNDGILVGSKVADKARITRSVIVNALRKLEGASIIQTKSLGVKGTSIKFLVPINMLQEAIINK